MSFAKLPKTIWALGLVSLLMDVSSEMVHGLLPVFLVSVLSSSYTTVGLIEGFGEATTLVLKVFSGPLSDWWGKRRPLVLFGYSMAAISKPFFALATSPLTVFGARIFDRMGKGIRGAPRDALIADISPKELRGAAFGLRQSLDTVGAVLGPAIAIAIMSLSNDNYRLVFWVSVIPAGLCVLVILLGVQEPEILSGNSKKKISFKVVREFSKSFWLISVIGAIFQLARFSEAFLILRARDLGLALSLAPLVLVAMNVVYSLAAYPIGHLSDRIKREWLIVLGFLALGLSDFALAMASSLWHVFIGVVLWGIHLSLTQGVLAALVADTAPIDYRGTAYGIFNLLSALALFIASAVAGVLWDQLGPAFTFMASALLSLLGLLGLFLFRHLWSDAA